MGNRNRRTAVSSEPMSAAGAEQPTENKAPTVPKTKEQIQRIVAATKNNFLFQSLEEDQLNDVIRVMFEKRFKAGQTIIQQGDDGDYFYILDHGECECFVAEQSKDILVKVYKKGEGFGELALMYNTKRAATIKAKTDVITWAMERSTFRSVVMSTANQKRKMYESFLETVPLLASLSKSERAKISDVLEVVTYNSGDYVIREAEQGDHFYIVVEGKARALKKLSNGTFQEVMKYGVGSYFGELALLYDTPRAANVVADGSLKCVRLDRASFVRLLGPCEDILRRNQDNYDLLSKHLKYQATNLTPRNSIGAKQSPNTSPQKVNQL